MNVNKSFNLTSSLFYLLLFFLIGPLDVFSHSGRTNQQGCHVNTSTNQYHCHDGPSTRFDIRENWCIVESISCGAGGCCGYSSYSSCKNASDSMGRNAGKCIKSNN